MRLLCAGLMLVGLVGGLRAGVGQEARKRVEVVVEVTASPVDLEESGTAAHGVLDERRIGEIPLFNRATGFTDLLTRTTPGVAADANGFAHPLGEHADTSISLDGQPMTDQQAKIFANQIDPNIIASLNATTGSPGAEFGDKTSLVVTVVTKSGLGRRPTGFVASDSGSFGTWSESGAVGGGNRRWGDFVAGNVSGSKRFLDTPEFEAIHAGGNSQSGFNRLDWKPREADLLHVNVGAGRSWFQTPNSYDAAAQGQDQRSQIRNMNVALGWTHVFSPRLLGSFVPFLRRDVAQYFGSANPLADTTAAAAQHRTLTNTGFRAETVYARGRHTVKVGGTYWHTLLHEQFSVGLTDPLFNALCVDGAGVAVVAAGVRSPNECAAAGYGVNTNYIARLLPYDLSRGGGLYRFDKSADVVEGALYGQDEVRLGSVLLSAGLRYDVYNGLSRGRQLAPRLGMAWKVPGAGTLVRLSYARLYETPYNENLIFASESGQDGSSANPFGSYRSEPVRPGTRNQFNVGLAQRVGKYLSVDADYYWKFTHTAFDFDTLFGTPITFSVAWRKSKIDGLAVRVNLAEVKGLSAYSVMGHVRSRFFTPEVGGLIFNSVPGSAVFRIDHGEEFEQTTQVRYQMPEVRRRRPWLAGVWRYNSGLALPDIVPVYTDALALTADQQAQMGLHCGAVFATPKQAVRACSAKEFEATRIRIPAPGTQDDDRNPVRVTPRTLFDLSAGEDALFRMERATVGAHVSVLNVGNTVALYNFLSTFSGTHFVPPRSVEAGVKVSF